MDSMAGSKDVFVGIELFCVIVFTWEYGTKIIVAPKRWEFFVAGMNMIDLVAILPFYLEIIASNVEMGIDARILRIVRLVR